MAQQVNPIQVGLCGWGDHDLYPTKMASKDRLTMYSAHFPVVEVDSTYHAIPSPDRMQQWADQTSPHFRFVIKAYRELTGHGRGKGAPERSWNELVHQLHEAVEPMKSQGKDLLLLFQFPPWYDCSKQHVQYIRRIRDFFSDHCLAIEFRNRTWFQSSFYHHTLQFLREEQLVHVICDEPQAGEGSVPIVPVVTHPQQSLIRFHGRNVGGWNNTGKPDWRKVRYAYQYTEKELQEWSERVKQIKQEVKQVTLLFNNNSQGDALGSARKMIELLSLQFEGLSPKQLKLF